MNITTPVFLNNVLTQWQQAQASVQPPLMVQAGAKATALALQLALQRPAPIVVVVGRGNNGGDGLEVASQLLKRGCACRVMAAQPEPQWHGEAALAWQRYLAAGGEVEPLADDLGFAALIIDALYGTGLNRAPHGAAQRAIETINEAAARGVPVLSLDLPSGLVSDTGATPGVAVHASATLSFLGAKPALYTGQGSDFCGEIVLEPLSPPITMQSPGFVNAPCAFPALLVPRRQNSNKGSFGTVAVVGGARGTVGAALLCARAALYCGAGKVLVQPVGDAWLEIDYQHPELMIRAQLDLDQADVVVIGPGLGTSPIALDLLTRVLASDAPAVIDADALNLIAGHADLQHALCARKAASIVTPHPLEAARLLQSDVKDVQSDRIAAALTIAGRFRASAILKGAGSIVAHPDGRWAINPTGNPGLASGGTGDVLAGVLGGLLAQAQDAFQTTLAGCYLHGEAADRLVARGIGPVGLTASELMAEIRAALNQHIRPG